MSHSAARQPRLSLPSELQREIGFDPQAYQRDVSRKYKSNVGNRKEQRRTDRDEKKNRSVSRGRHRTLQEHDNILGRAKSSKVYLGATELQKRPQSTKTKRVTDSSSKSKPVRKTISQSLSSDSEESISSSRSSSPALVLDSSSKAFKDRSAQDDAEIAALEKKLGLKSKKLPKSFNDDGLDELLDGLDDDIESKKRKREGQEWLEQKRQRTGMPITTSKGDGEDQDEEEIDEDDVETEDDEILGLDSQDEDEGGPDLDGFEDHSLDESVDEDDKEDFEGFESDSGQNTAKQATRVRENPYVAPVTDDTKPAKYVPPSLRQTSNNNTETIQRLRRQLQGHLNKLSEANLVSILNEVEKVYQSNARQDVSSVLIDLLLSTFCNRSALQNTFVILHAAFVTAIYKVIGTDFGADLLSKLIERFDQNADQEGAGKERLNLVSLLSNLFTFHMVGSVIIFDHIRLLLDELTENNTELLLRIVRDCGPQLRQDDPAALKSIVLLMQSAARKVTENGGKLSVRTQFMIETITDLKNNKMKAATNAAGLTSEHLTRMRKVLGSLNSRNLRASEPLRISRNDIQNSDKKGKWWLVGASWKGNDTPIASLDDEKFITERELEVEADEVNMLALARQYHMNTDIRRSIFASIMSAVDCQDAYVRIQKLRLKRAQEPEIAKVLLRCAGAEGTYNPYYSLLASRLCSDKRMVKAFEFAIWTFFGRLGEKPDDEDSDEADPDESIEMTEIASLAKMYGHLIAEGTLSLGILKVLNLMYLKERGEMFVELLLVTILTTAYSKAGDAAVEKVFMRALQTPQVVQGLRYFISKHVKKSDLVAKKDEKKLKLSCRVAIDVLSIQNSI